MCVNDVLGRRLAVLQRLAEGVEPERDGEPMWARSVVRAVRTQAAVQAGSGWVWPAWLEGQIDPCSPAFMPRGSANALTNSTQRNWTMVGSFASPFRATVDGRGLVTPWTGGWSLDWWVGAEDRWHLPSRETSVRQWLIDRSPVVETAMRIPGGDAVHRVYALPPARGTGELAVVEIENRSPAPFALALAVRPYNPDGLAVVERIALHGQTVTVDGRPALLLPRRPSKLVMSSFGQGDVAAQVTAEHAADTVDAVRCSLGMALAAAVYPVAHGAALRVAIPLDLTPPTRRQRVIRRRPVSVGELPKVLAGGTAVARGWAAQARRGMRLSLPEGRMADAVEANRRFLLLFHGGDGIVSRTVGDRHLGFREAAYVLGALSRYGFHDEVREVLRSYPSRQRFDGRFWGRDGEWAANGCALHAVGTHWRLTRDANLVSELLPSISLGARWIQRKRDRHARRGGDPSTRGLLPPGMGAGQLGPPDHFYWNDFWAVAGLRDAAALLRAGGNDFGAGLCARWAEELWSDVRSSMTLAAGRLGTLAIPAGPTRPIDSAIIGSLVACQPLGLLDPDDLAIAATADRIRERFCVEDAFFDSASQRGLDTVLTLQLAAVELARGERAALDRLEWLLSSSTPTFTWPEAIHPRLDGGCAGSGHHALAAAEFLTLVRNLLVREVRRAGLGTAEVELALFSMLPARWVGQPVEVHDAPTAAGTVSFALRWHGPRPALLWEVRAHHDVGRVRLTAPGLDPMWATVQPRGEALLALATEGSG